MMIMRLYLMIRIILLEKSDFLSLGTRGNASVWSVTAIGIMTM